MDDRRLRERLRRLWDEGSSPMDPAAVHRLARHIAVNGRAVRRRYVVRRATFGFASCLVVAFGSVGARIALDEENLPTPIAVTDAPRTIAETSVVADDAVRRICEQDGPRGAVEFAERETDSALDLGERALAVVSKGGHARVEALEPCRTILAMDRGSLNVHARDLAGGELRVLAPLADVVVHGTVFSVVQGEDLVVRVVEGVVSVEPKGSEAIVLRAGELVRIRRDQPPTREGVSVPEREQIEVALGLSPSQPVAIEEVAPEPRPVRVRRSRRVSSDRAVTAPSEVPAPVATPAPPRVLTVDDLLTEGDVLRRAGDYDAARRLYRQVADGHGVTAEAAWLSLARMELQLGRFRAAREALALRTGRFGDGSLGAEASWISIRIARALRDRATVEREATRILARWPHSPQAGPARRALGSR